MAKSIPAHLVPASPGDYPYLGTLVVYADKPPYVRDRSPGIPTLIDAALHKGAHGYLSKMLPARDLVAANETIAANEIVVSEPSPRSRNALGLDVRSGPRTSNRIPPRHPPDVPVPCVRHVSGCAARLPATGRRRTVAGDKGYDTRGVRHRRPPSGSRRASRNTPPGWKFSRVVASRLAVSRFATSCAGVSTSGRRLLALC